MSISRVAAILMAVILVGLSETAAAASGPLPVVTSAQLVNDAHRYDGRTVAFKGEVVGSPIVQGDRVWVNVTDGTYALGVLLPRKDLARIHVFGTYWHKGDVVEVIGVFHRTDPGSGGETDIRASSLTVLRPGRPLSHPVPPWLLWATVLTVLLAGGLYGLDRRRRRDREET